jgi:hypothetical protein
MVLRLKGAELLEGNMRVETPHLGGIGPFLEEVGSASAAVEWIVRAEGPDASIQVTARSPKGGVVRTPWVELGGSELPKDPEPWLGR